MLVLVKIQYQIGLVEETLIIQSQYYEYMMGLLKKRHIIVETTDLKYCLIAANFFRNCNSALYLIRQRGVWQLSARY